MNEYYNPLTNSYPNWDDKNHCFLLDGCTHKNDMPEESKQWFLRRAKPGYSWERSAKGPWPEEVPIEPAPAGERRQAVCAVIDQAAGSARSRFATNTSFIQAEYELAYADAKDWIAGNHQGTCPQTVKDHADAYQVTEQEAAQEIKTTGDAWFDVVRAVRKIRLHGKQAVERAADDADFMAVAQSFIDQLNALKPA